MNGEPRCSGCTVSPEKAQKTEQQVRSRRAFLSIIHQHGWRKLVSDLQRRPELAQRCSLCGTWCASNRVKMHLARSHRTVSNMQIEKLCQSQVADIRSPCNLCGSTSKDPCDVEGLRAEARKAWSFRPRKVEPQFQLRLPWKADSLVPPCCVVRHSGRDPALVVNICHLENMATLIHA